MADLKVLAGIISSLCGWLYFLLWSISYWPQPILNHRRRSTDGLTFDFPLLNLYGSTCYTITSAVFLYSATVRAEYAVRHPASPIPTVRFNDFCFGWHSMLICSVTFSQFWPCLWGWNDAPNNKQPTRATLVLLYGSMLAVVTCVCFVLFEAPGWGWIDAMYTMTGIKLSVTMFKCIPQIIQNHRRRSTEGLAMGAAILDVVGSFLSLFQLIIDSSMQNDWSGLTGNPLKFGLANISLLFDFAFLAQRYLLYQSNDDDPDKEAGPERESIGNETDPLLGPHGRSKHFGIDCGS